MPKPVSRSSALALLLLSVFARAAISQDPPLPPLEADVVQEEAQPPLDEPEPPSLDCSKVPKALWSRTPACSGLKAEELTIAGCLDNVVATDSGLTPECDDFIACFEKPLPTRSCLDSYRNVVDVDGDCVSFAGKPLVCLVSNGDLTVGIAPGHLMPQDQEERPVWNAVRRLIPAGGREESMAEASEAIYDHKTRADEPLTNRSFALAYPLFERLVAEKALPGTPELLYVFGPVIEDSDGKRLVKVEAPKNGGKCAVTLADRFRQADAIDHDTGKKLPKETRMQREANRVALALALAPLMGIPNCGTFDHHDS